MLGTPRSDLLRPANIELKEKLAESISVTKLVSFGGVPRSNQVAQGLLFGVGDPDRRQVTASMQTCELLGVSAIRLYPVARLDRAEGRRDHVALDPHLRELPVQTVPARTGLVADPQLSFALQLLDRPSYRLAAVGNRSHRLHRPVLVGHRHGDRLRVHDQAHPSCNLLH